MKSIVTSKEFLIGLVAGIVLVKFVAPRLGAVPVIGPVLSKVA